MLFSVLLFAASAVVTGISAPGSSDLNDKGLEIPQILPGSTMGIISHTGEPSLWKRDARAFGSDRNENIRDIMTSQRLFQFLLQQPSKRWDEILGHANPSLNALIPGVIIECIQHGEKNLLIKILETIDALKGKITITVQDSIIIVKKALVPHQNNFNPNTLETQDIFWQWVLKQGLPFEYFEETKALRIGYLSDINGLDKVILDRYGLRILEEALGRGPDPKHQEFRERLFESNILSERFKEELKEGPFVIAFLKKDYEMLEILSPFVTGGSVSENEQAFFYFLAHELGDTRLIRYVEERFPKGIQGKNNVELMDIGKSFIHNSDYWLKYEYLNKLIQFGDKDFLRKVIHQDANHIAELCGRGHENLAIEIFNSFEDVSKKQLIEMVTILIDGSRVRLLDGVLKRLKALDPYWNPDPILEHINRDTSPAILDYIFTANLEFSRAELLKWIKSGSCPANLAVLKKLAPTPDSLTEEEYFNLLSSTSGKLFELLLHGPIGESFTLTEEQVGALANQDGRLVEDIAALRNVYPELLSREVAESLYARILQSKSQAPNLRTERSVYVNNLLAALDKLISNLSHTSGSQRIELAIREFSLHAISAVLEDKKRTQLPKPAWVSDIKEYLLPNTPLSSSKSVNDDEWRKVSAIVPDKEWHDFITSLLDSAEGISYVVGLMQMPQLWSAISTSEFTNYIAKEIMIKVVLTSDSTLKKWIKVTLKDLAEALTSEPLIGQIETIVWNHLFMFLDDTDSHKVKQSVRLKTYFSNANVKPRKKGGRNPPPLASIKGPQCGHTAGYKNINVPPLRSVSRGLPRSNVLKGLKF